MQKPAEAQEESLMENLAVRPNQSPGSFAQRWNPPRLEGRKFHCEQTEAGSTRRGRAEETEKSPASTPSPTGGQCLLASSGTNSLHSSGVRWV